MRVPDPHVADDKWMMIIGSHAPTPAFAVNVEAPKIHGKIALAVGFIVFESNKGQRADVDRTPGAIQLWNAQHRVEPLRILHVEAKTVDVAFAGDVPRKYVQAVRPPEPGAAILVEWQYLIGQDLSLSALHSQIAIENIEDLGAVFEEKSVTDAVVPYAIAHDEVIGAVDSNPAIVALPDRSAHH